MWGSKAGEEGAALVAACRGMVGAMEQLGVAVDGGKDSLSMAARVGNDTVMAPGGSRGPGGQRSWGQRRGYGVMAGLWGLSMAAGIGTDTVMAPGGSRDHGVTWSWGGHVVMQGSCDMGLWWGYGVIMGSLWGDGDSIWWHAWGVTPSWRPVGHVVMGVKGNGVKGGVMGSVVGLWGHGGAMGTQYGGTRGERHSHGSWWVM